MSNDVSKGFNLGCGAVFGVLFAFFLIAAFGWCLIFGIPAWHQVEKAREKARERIATSERNTAPAPTRQYGPTREDMLKQADK